ncbi:MAG: NAD kinase [Rhodocyclales bacterium]|jgi:NAD+ kinase|nr:NAD kinase [Rhodocyclales bacterium]
MGIPFKKSIRCVGLVGKYQSADVAAALPQLAAFLRSYGVRVLIEEGIAPQVDAHGEELASYETMGSEAEVVVVLGGDGTMLYAARRMAEFGVPLAGINQGRLGFMTDIARKDMLTAVGELLTGHFTAEPRLLLNGEIWRDGERLASSLAFNEVVVNKGDLGRMIEMRVEVNGEFVYLLRADGMIVATPTGSTAYALSADGPILHPGIAGIAMVPLCPHTLSNRPISIGADSHIDITLVSTHIGRVHFDGQERFDLLAGDRVRIARSPQAVTLLHPPGYSYYAMLRSKLHWSEPPKH